MQRCHTYKICSLKIYLKSTGGEGCERRIKVFVKYKKKKKNIFFFGGGGVSGQGGGGQVGGGGVRVDVNREVKFL